MSKRITQQSQLSTLKTQTINRTRSNQQIKPQLQQTNNKKEIFKKEKQKKLFSLFTDELHHLISYKFLCKIQTIAQLKNQSTQKQNQGNHKHHHTNSNSINNLTSLKCPRQCQIQTGQLTQQPTLQNTPNKQGKHVDLLLLLFCHV